MNGKRRRLLFLSYFVPPRNAIGTLRSVHLLKHLSKFGWDVTTITASFERGSNGSAKLADYIETGYIDVKNTIKRLVGIGDRSTSVALNLGNTAYGAKRGTLGRAIWAVYDAVTYPDEFVGWLPFAMSAVRRMLRNGQWDAVLSTSPPVTANIALALVRARVPWVADLRDLWAEDDSHERSTLQRLFDDPLERASLSRANAFTVSSELSAARFQHRYPGKPCFAIYNGFDLDEWRTIEFGREPQCTIVYAGSLFRGKRDPSVLFAAVRKILDEGLAEPHELRVDLYTSAEPWLIDLIARYRLQDVVRVHGLIARNAVLAAERRADRLLVVSWDSPTSEGVVAGKLFEYFGARRPILAIGGPETFSLGDLLRETGAGIRCRTVEEAKAALLDALAEHRAGTTRTIPASAVESYRGDACAGRFAEVLDRIVVESES